MGKDEKSVRDHIQEVEKARRSRDLEKLNAAKRAALASGKVKLEQIAKAAETTRLDELRKLAKRIW